MDKKELIQKAIDDGNSIAKKIDDAKTLGELEELSNEIDKYSNFVNENFGIVDEFAEHENEKFCELSFYVCMAVEDKKDHLQYYNLHQEKNSNGVLNFLDYLRSEEWVITKNTE